jgi:hypothetical protein
MRDIAIARQLRDAFAISRLEDIEAWQSARKLMNRVPCSSSDNNPQPRQQSAGFVSSRQKPRKNRRREEAHPKNPTEHDRGKGLLNIWPHNLAYIGFVSHAGLISC